MKYYIFAHFVDTVFNVPVITIRTARNNWYDVKAILILKYTMRKRRLLCRQEQQKLIKLNREEILMFFFYYLLSVFHPRPSYYCYFLFKARGHIKIKKYNENISSLFISVLSYFTSNLLPRENTA